MKQKAEMNKGKSSFLTGKSAVVSHLSSNWRYLFDFSQSYSSSLCVLKEGPDQVLDL